MHGSGNIPGTMHFECMCAVCHRNNCCNFPAYSGVLTKSSIRITIDPYLLAVLAM